jgi:hypothetical protein
MKFILGCGDNGNSTDHGGRICVSQNMDSEINLILWEVHFVFCVLPVFNFDPPLRTANTTDEAIDPRR